MPRKASELTPEQVEAFKVRAAEQLKSAQVCFDAGRYNSSTSRAYYALYAGMCWYTKCDDVEPSEDYERSKNWGPHPLMRDLFIAEYRRRTPAMGTDDARGLKNKINEIKDYRTAADYKSLGVNEDIARRVLRHVRQFLEAMGAVEKEPPPAPEAAGS